MLRGRFQEAWLICEQLERNDPTCHRHRFNRGWFMLHQGKLQEGARCLEAGRLIDVYGNHKDCKSNKPVWNQQDLQGKTIIMHLEGGFGDNIMQVRFATEFAQRGARCYVNCDPRIHSLFRRVKGVEDCIIHRQVLHTYHDYNVFGFSAVWMLGHEFENLPNKPYLNVDPDLDRIWRGILQSDRPKVGIRWSGLPDFEHQQFRIFPPRLLIDLHKKFPHIQFVSLQKDDNLIELPDAIKDHVHLFENWDDTAACVNNLDLVISSCTSVAHVSAALGKPTWILVPMLPYHCWAYGDDHSPWYPDTCTLYRQTKFGDWQEPFERIEQALDQMFPAP